MSARPGPMHPPYRREDGHWLIELRLNDPLQLFNTIDPTPFPQKDLDPAAETFILDAVQEFHHDDDLKLVIHLPSSRLDDSMTTRIRDAVRHYFAWRAEEEAHRRRRMLREGRLALLIGMVFVLACTAGRSLLLALDPGLMVETLAEGLLVIGWVALWRPVDVFLYGWWPLRRRARLYRRIAELPVTFREGT